MYLDPFSIEEVFICIAKKILFGKYLWLQSYSKPKALSKHGLLCQEGNIDISYLCAQTVQRYCSWEVNIDISYLCAHTVHRYCSWEGDNDISYLCTLYCVLSHIYALIPYYDEHTPTYVARVGQHWNHSFFAGLLTNQSCMESILCYHRNMFSCKRLKCKIAQISDHIFISLFKLICLLLLQNLWILLLLLYRSFTKLITLTY